MKKRIVFITGAGVSVPSGIKPFRGPDGIYEAQPDLKYKLRPDSFETDPQFLYDFHQDFIKEINSKTYNKIHELISQTEAPVITMNIDNFHELSGSKNVFHVHGSVFNIKCRSCDYKESNKSFKIDEKCPQCGLNTLRHDIVLFKESLNPDFFTAIDLVRFADIVIQIGSSGEVYPMADLPSKCQGIKICINPESPKNSHLFNHLILGDVLENLEKLINNDFKIE
jgi:NAD-dependent deacetylase